MRLWLVSALLLAFLLPSPALAHGPEHEETASAAETASGPSGTGEVVAPSDDSAASSASPSGKEPNLTVSSVLKNLHPATVHFPIGLLLAASLVELLAWRRRSERLLQAATVMVGAGAIGAVVAVLFGWIHTGLWFGGSGAMQWHRWLGSGLALAAILAWYLGRDPDRRGRFRLVLFTAVGAILVQGYLGGELAHGPMHLAGAH